MTRGKRSTKKSYQNKKQKVQESTKVQEKDSNRRSSRGKNYLVDNYIHLEDDSTSKAVPKGVGKREAAYLNRGFFGNVKKIEENNIRDSKKRSVAKKKEDYTRNMEKDLDKIVTIFENRINNTKKWSVQKCCKELKWNENTWYWHFTRYFDLGIRPTGVGHRGKRSAIHPSLIDEIKKHAEGRSLCGLGFKGLADFIQFIKPYLQKSLTLYGVKDTTVRLKRDTYRRLLNVICPERVNKGQQQNVQRLKADVDLTAALSAAAGVKCAMRGENLGLYPEDPTGQMLELMFNVDAMSLLYNEKWQKTMVYLTKGSKKALNSQNIGVKAGNREVNKQIQPDDATTTTVRGDDLKDTEEGQDTSRICTPPGSKLKQSTKTGLPPVGFKIEFLSQCSSGAAVAMCVTVKDKDLDDKIEFYLLDETSRLFFCIVGPNADEKDVVKLKQKHFILKTIDKIRTEVIASIEATTQTTNLSKNNEEVDDSRIYDDKNKIDLNETAEMKNKYQALLMMDGCGPELNAMTDSIYIHLSNLAGDQDGNENGEDGNEHEIGEDEEEDDVMVNEKDDFVYRTKSRRTKQNEDEVDEGTASMFIEEGYSEEDLMPDAGTNVSNMTKDNMLDEEDDEIIRIFEYLTVIKTHASATHLFQPNDCGKMHALFRKFAKAWEGALLRSDGNTMNGEAGLPHFHNQLWNILGNKRKYDQQKKICNYGCSSKKINI